MRALSGHLPSLTSLGGHKIKIGEFSRTVHRNIEDFVSSLDSSNKTEVGFVLTAICCFSLGGSRGGLSPACLGFPVSRAPLRASWREGSTGLAHAWGSARLRTGATLNKLRRSRRKAEPQLPLSLGNNRESGELLVGGNSNY